MLYTYNIVVLKTYRSNRLDGCFSYTSFHQYSVFYIHSTTNTTHVPTIHFHLARYILSAKCHNKNTISFITTLHLTMAHFIRSKLVFISFFLFLFNGLFSLAFLLCVATLLKFLNISNQFIWFVLVRLPKQFFRSLSISFALNACLPASVTPIFG